MCIRDSPYAVWMLVGFFKTVPLGIEEAARVDGANKFQTFTKIVLPLVMPGIVADRKSVV